MPCNDLIEGKITSPLGDICTVHCPVGIHSVSLDSHINDQTFRPNLSVAVRILSPSKNSSLILKDLQEWLRTYFESPHKTSEIALPFLCPIAGQRSQGFYARVWKTLVELVSPGQVITYGNLAKKAGSVGAVRAVGTAMRRNPIGILIPCHRVVKSSGEIGLYCGGERQKVKKWLLKHEGCSDYQ